MPWMQIKGFSLQNLVRMVASIQLKELTQKRHLLKDDIKISNFVTLITSIIVTYIELVADLFQFNHFLHPLSI